MTLPEGMYAATPPTVRRKGKQPKLLTDEKVKILLASPNTWYVIGRSDKFISGVKANIESMTQANISHLATKGKFEIQQRKNTEDTIDIYCQWVPTEEEII
jgi:hypothetical protein